MKRNEINEIVEGELYATSLKGVEQGGERIVELGIKSLISLGVMPPENLPLSIENKTYVPWKDISEDPEVDITCMLPKLLLLVKNETKPLLIHCRWGVDRTGALIVAHLMATDSCLRRVRHPELRYSGALKIAQNGRYYLEPNERYKKQIIRFFTPPKLQCKQE